MGGEEPHHGEEGGLSSGRSWFRTSGPLRVAITAIIPALLMANVAQSASPISAEPRGPSGVGAGAPPTEPIAPRLHRATPNVGCSNAAIRSSGRSPTARNHSARRARSGAPPTSQPRYVPDEVIVEITGNPAPQTIAALADRFRLTWLEERRIELASTTFHRWRIPDGRSVPVVLCALEGDGMIRSAQPNYLYTIR